MPPQLAENRVSSPLYHWYRGFIQGKTRIVIAWVFAIILALSAREGPHYPGVVLCFLGAALRHWASGYLRKDTRPAVGGPYAYMRNPLYLGTLLMAMGTAWSAEQRVLAIAILVVFGSIYHFIILDEEAKLERIFGEPYRLYKTQVPRFFPTFLKPGKTVLEQINPDPQARVYDRGIAGSNRAYEAWLSMAGLIGGVALVVHLWKTFG